MATEDTSKTQNILTRVSSLPLISSAYDICSSLYHYTKERHPCISSIFNVAEMVAAVALGSAKGGARPILDQFQPQIATVNAYACQQLDKLEKTVPYLHQPTHQVIEDGVTITKSVICSTVSTARGAASKAKEIMDHRVAEAVDLTKDIVQDTVGLTKAVVNATVNTAVSAASDAKELVTHRVSDAVNLGRETVRDTVDLTRSVVSSTVGPALQAAHGTKDFMAGHVKSCGAVQEGTEMTNYLRHTLTSRVDAMLDKTEEMVDHYLPMTEEELAKLATEVQGFDATTLEDQKKNQSYFVRLGSLSSKVRHRAYLHSLQKVHDFRENTLNTLSQLQLVISLIEHLEHGVGQRIQETQETLTQMLLEWTQAHPRAGQMAAEGNSQPEVESRTLNMLRMVTQELGPAYSLLVSTVAGLPRHIRERVEQAAGSVRQLQASFTSASSFQDLSSSVLAQSQERIAEACEGLDTLLGYIVENTPLNWVVGPFRAASAATDITTAAPHSQQATKTALEEPAGAGEAAGRAGEAQGRASKPSKAASKAKKVEEEGDREEREGTSEASVEEAMAPSVPKKAKKQVKETEKVAGKKAGKSALGQVSDAPEQELQQ